MCLWDGSQHAKTREVLQQAAFGEEMMSGWLCSAPHFQLFITVVLSASMNLLFSCVEDVSFSFCDQVVKLQ